ncbi:hypothetical protein GGI08_000607 [Coemansia sp. S2]|nr:hypothetical protein GGI08_000607 [Coemansia sp. S2]
MELCEDSEAYEDIDINVHTDTVEQVKDAIASELGIEADEFVFYHKASEEEYKSEPGTLFKTAYIRGDYISRVEEGLETNPLNTHLYKSKFYRGKTGMLQWLMSQNTHVYCVGSGIGCGQLAVGFAELIDIFNAQHNIPSTEAAPSTESSTTQE